MLNFKIMRINAYKPVFILLLPLCLFCTACARGDSDIYFSMDNSSSWTNFQQVKNLNFDSSSSFSIIKDGDKYKIWKSIQEGMETFFYYSESDDGINWTDEVKIIRASDVLSDPWIGNLSVIKDGDHFKMWIGVMILNGSDFTCSTFYSESNDGKDWGEFIQVIWPRFSDNGLISTVPCSVVKTDGKYRMWSGGFSNSTLGGIVFSESDDGKLWNDFVSESIDISNFSGLFSVIADAGSYRIWYTYNNSINTGESDDGINWKNSKTAVSPGSQGQADTNGANSPVVINDGGIGKMWYIGTDSDEKASIIYAETK
ncbi:MAG: hypothetical protein KAZ87_06805 [Spirochaetes bacterium]|nr:hypothetical protein [Spirochaetota bacterium]